MYQFTRNTALSLVALVSGLGFLWFSLFVPEAALQASQANNCLILFLASLAVNFYLRLKDSQQDLEDTQTYENQNAMERHLSQRIDEIERGCEKSYSCPSACKRSRK